MYPWIIILFVLAGAVFGLDYFVRRKKWKDNSKAEKRSLIVHMLCGGPYVFLSGLGMLWGITSGSSETAFGKILCDVTLVMAGYYFIIAIAAMILSFVFRKKGKVKASIRVNVIALLYIILVLAVNGLAEKFL